jgi:glycosyltransferase involved in cell wall biosynthesis
VNYLVVVDHLGLGGAQRQVVELARGLKARGHGVDIFIYFPQYRFFRALVEEHQIPIHEYRKGKGFSVGVVRQLRSLLRGGKFDVVVSYLNSPNVYTELASALVQHAATVIVSERCSHHDDKSALVSITRRLLHALSDCVVTNSETHAVWLKRKWWLTHKVACIYNGLDLGARDPARVVPGGGAQLRLLAVGRVCPQKNVTGLIVALEIFRWEHGYVPRISWVGKREGGREGRRYERQVNELLSGLPEVSRQWRWLGEQPDMGQLLREHDALIHPSLYEGLPNAVCEALGAGMPVLISNVCDHPLLVADNERGFVFDPSEPRSIAGAIGKLVHLNPGAWRNFCANARRYAEENLSTHRMVTAYETLAVTLLQEKRRGVA